MMDRINSDKENRAMLENALADFLERQPIAGHSFQMVQSDSKKMTYVLVDRFFSAYQIVGRDGSFYITGFADNGNSYIPTYGNTPEEVYNRISGMVPIMNLSPEPDGRFCYRKEGLFNPEFLDFEYTFRNVVYNVEAYRKSVFEGMTDGKPTMEPLSGTDQSVDHQIRKFAEMSKSVFLRDLPEKGEYSIRSPEGIIIEYDIYQDFMNIWSQLDDINGRAKRAAMKPFELYVMIQEKMPFSAVFDKGRLLYVNRDIGTDSPMRKCIMELSFDCLAAHDAYRLHAMDLDI